jgi:hypothetical protein
LNLTTQALRERGTIAVSATATTEHVVTQAKSGSEVYRATDGFTYSSSNLAVPYFGTVQENTISKFGTIVNNATDGLIFTATEQCNVMMKHQFAATSACYVGISKNASSAQLDADLAVLPEGIVGAMQYQASSNVPAEAVFIGKLEVGDSLAAHLSLGETAQASAQNQGVQLIVTPVEATFLAAVPVQKVAYLKDIKSTGTSGGTFTSGSYLTRTLNTIEGDSEIVSLSSDQFTLQAGKYNIEAFAPAKDCGGNKLKLRNITNSTDDIIGTYYFSGSVMHSDFRGELTITSPKTYEIQHRCGTTRATDGFGAAASYGDNEVYTTVKITKLR